MECLYMPGIGNKKVITDWLIKYYIEIINMSEYIIEPLSSHCIDVK